jgi:hypothetical protein
VAGLPYVSVFANPTVVALRAALSERVDPGDLVVVDAESSYARTEDRAANLLAVWGHWGPPEVEEALRAQPALGDRAWVVRYPAHDPDAARRYFASVWREGPTEVLLDGAIEITRFDRPTDAAPGGPGASSP